MVRLTRLNHVPMVLNSDLIEHIDVTPDTVITLTTGQILRVRESADEVVRRIVEFRRRILDPEIAANFPADAAEDAPESDDAESQAGPESPE
jgi:flagellar protein FlbD